MIHSLIILLLIGILASLVSASYYLLHFKSGNKRLVKALTIRITLSLVLFILIMIAFALGWITPNN